MQINRETKTITISQNTGITISVALLLVVFSAIVAATTWVVGIQGNVSELASATAENKTRISSLEIDSNEAKVKYAEIQTQLKSIDTTLLEIKQSLRAG